MWLLIPLILINALADNKDFFLKYRLEVGSFPINILDVAQLVCLIVVLLPGWGRSGEKADSVHPLLVPVMVLFAVASLLGTSVSLCHDFPLRWTLTPMRNLLTIPMAMAIGYRTLTRTDQFKWTVRLFFWASIISAILALAFVRGAADDIAGGGKFDALRKPGLGGDLGLLGLTFIPFALISRTRFLPLLASICLLVLCVVCALLLPHRSLWVLSGAMLIFAMLVLPIAPMSRRIGVAGGIAVVAAVSIVIGTFAISSMTGQDYGAYVGRRLLSLVPGDHEGITRHAWDTRLPGAIREVQLWAASPLLGRGFGIQDSDGISHPEIEGYRHNVWTSTLAETGPVGLAAFLLLMFGTLVVGYRLVKDKHDRDSVWLGAVAAIVGLDAILISTFSLSINTQRGALPVALMFGLALKCRALQLTARRIEAEDALLAGPAKSIARQPRHTLFVDGAVVAATPAMPFVGARIRVRRRKSRPTPLRDAA